MHLASREDKRGREEKNARLILRITAAAFSLALPNIWESRGWEEAHDNLLETGIEQHHAPDATAIRHPPIQLTSVSDDNQFCEGEPCELLAGAAARHKAPGVKQLPHRGQVGHLIHPDTRHTIRNELRFQSQKQ